jgi:TolB-like protein
VDGEPAKVGARAFDVLMVLIENCDRVVGRKELFERVWPGRVIEDQNLTVQISVLRKLLGPDVIVNVSGHGYQFTAVLTGQIGAPASSGASGNDALASGDLPTSMTDRPGARLAMWLAPTMVLALALGYLLAGKIAWTTGAVAPMGRSIQEKSIAVLPFADMSEKRDQEYFSDGLSEELINRLSHSQDLKVIARTSSFSFKGKNDDIPTIAGKLGVANLLEGSVRRDGNQTRITVQLIRAADGTHLWSQTYERNVSSIFKVQDEIAATVAKALTSTLNQDARKSSGNLPSTQAYNLVLRGNYAFNRTTKADVEQAIAFYQQAIAADPDYAVAWTKLSLAYIRHGGRGWAPIAAEIERARSAAQRALQIDSTQDEAHLALGLVARDFDWDWRVARKEFEAAIKLDPNDRHAAMELASLGGALTGNIDEELRESRKDLVTDPLDAPTMFGLGWMLLLTNHLEESIAVLRDLERLNPSFAGCHSVLAQSLALMGRYPEALAALKSESNESSILYASSVVYSVMGKSELADAALRNFEKRFGASHAYNIAHVHALRGEADQAFAWLERAYLERDGGITYMKFDHYFEALRGDPRFQAWLHKMKLEEDAARSDN